MKITGIDIGEYRQFKNIKFDFTYPKGHPKEGQPLEKVCFIGQSGTGKTTLLNIIWHFFLIANDGYNIQKNKSASFGQIYPYRTFEEDISISVDTGYEVAKFDNSYVKKSTVELSDTVSIFKRGFEWAEKVSLYDKIKADDKICLYIDDNAINHSYSLTANRNGLDVENKNYIATPDEIFLKNEKRDEFLYKISESKVIGLNSLDSNFLWFYLLGDIDKYDEQLKKIAIDLIQKNNSFSANRLSETLSKWQKENPNPKLDIAVNCLNPILKHFYLETDTEGTEALIVIKTQNGKQLNYSTLSTGTKQLLVTAIATYKSAIKRGVILFDEPERSLFPDIQRELIKYYTSLAPEAQFFYATHSPIIASAFEPCERFILYFNESGEVEFHNGVAPEGDDPNDILRQDFDMAELMLQKGLEEYERYRQLAMQIRVETDAEKKNQLIAERVELGNRYNFAGQYAQSK